MNNQVFCQSCTQKHQCQEVYRQLGKVQGSSVALKVVVALLLPIVIFIVSLAGFEKILGQTLNTKGFVTAVSALLGLLVTAAVILILKDRKPETEDYGN